jgi:hypothetical protein
VNTGCCGVLQSFPAGPGHIRRQTRLAIAILRSDAAIACTADYDPFGVATITNSNNAEVNLLGESALTPPAQALVIA